MLRKIILISLLIIADIVLGYYSTVVNGSYFSRFMFFLLSAFTVCLLVLSSVKYILPSENFKDARELEKMDELD